MTKQHLSFLGAFLKILGLLLFLTASPLKELKAQEDIYAGTVFTPEGTTLKAPQTHFAPNKDQTRHSVFISHQTRFPLFMTATGPLGGIVIKEIPHPSQFKNLVITEGISRISSSRPTNLPELPTLCPRLIRQGSRFIYDASRDPLNNTPQFQLLEATHDANAYQTITQMDGQNVLLLKHITLRYDYEDSHIIDYMGPHPLTGKPQTIYEGEGGFFANIHYAIIPHDPQIKKLDRQTLLHLAQGKLHEITPPANINKPPLRVHSFLPGPFLSGSNYLYDMCEWGDTTYQAPKQELDYINMALWDWDYSQGSSQHIWLIVWEGDEEDWLVQKGLLNPFTLTDDLIGIFEIKREQTLTPLTLINPKGDFEIMVQTGTIQKFTR